MGKNVINYTFFIECYIILKKTLKRCVLEITMHFTKLKLWKDMRQGLGHNNFFLSSRKTNI